MTLAAEDFDAVAASEEVPVSSIDLSYFRTLMYAGIVGAAGGLVATVYYFVLEQCLELVWETGREAIVPFFPAWLPHWHYTWMVATVGGLGVGLCLYFLGLPGEMALVIDRVHDAGRLDPKQTPGMVATSLVSITAGGSLGPEAPLVQINGSLGSWIADKLNMSLKNM
ncbi:MAG: chloride channel protein, partial [Cyanobacteria bacterium J06632_3]